MCAARRGAVWGFVAVFFVLGGVGVLKRQEARSGAAVWRVEACLAGHVWGGGAQWVFNGGLNGVGRQAGAARRVVGRWRPKE